MTDYDLFYIRHTVFRNIKEDARAAEAMAEEYGFDVNSVRGRLSRANTPGNRIKLAKSLAYTSTTVSSSVKRQINVVSRSEATFAARQADLEDAGKEVAGVFLADVHLPYTRWDALDLAMQIVQDVQPVYVTGMNDAVDNAGLGKWEDTRSIKGRVWSADIENLRRSEEELYRLYYSVLPKNSLVLGVAGNHDNWYARHLRSVSAQTSERSIADYMEFLESLGVLQFGRGAEENAIHLSPKLVWWHGQFMSVRAETNAKKTIEQFVEDGMAKTVVVGHTHRPSRIDGYTIGYDGVTFYNAPCLSRLTKLPWMKRAPKGWKNGVVVNYWTPGTRSERGYLVVFYREGNKLVADFNGKRYSTTYDDSVPEEFL